MTLRRTGLRDDLLRHPRQNALLRHHSHRLQVTLRRTGLRDDLLRHLRQNALPRHHSHRLQVTLRRTGLRDDLLPYILVKILLSFAIIAIAFR